MASEGTDLIVVAASDPGPSSLAARIDAALWRDLVIVAELLRNGRAAFDRLTPIFRTLAPGQGGKGIKVCGSIWDEMSCSQIDTGQ